MSWLELEQTCFQGLSIPTTARTRARPWPFAAVAQAVTTAVSFVSRAGDAPLQLASWIAAGTSGLQSLSMTAE